MPTFAEFQQNLNQTRFQKAVLSHLVEYLDRNFMPALDQKPEKVLLTDDKVAVPQVSFDSVIEGLNNWIKSCQQAEQQLMNANITVEQPKQPEPAPQPAAEEQPITPTSEAQP